MDCVRCSISLCLCKIAESLTHCTSTTVVPCSSTEVPTVGKMESKGPHPNAITQERSERVSVVVLDAVRAFAFTKFLRPSTTNSPPPSPVFISWCTCGCFYTVQIPFPNHVNTTGEEKGSGSVPVTYTPSLLQP